MPTTKSKPHIYRVFDYPETQPSPTGDGFEPEFSVVYDEKTQRDEVKATGKTNLYAKIQEAAAGVSLQEMIDKYHRGEVSLEDLWDGESGVVDLTQFPNDLMAAQQQLIAARNYFNSLPVEVRREFDHSESKFLAAVGDGSYQEIFKKFMPQAPQPAVQKPVEKVDPEVGLTEAQLTALAKRLTQQQGGSQ